MLSWALCPLGKVSLGGLCPKGTRAHEVQTSSEVCHRHPVNILYISNPSLYGGLWGAESSGLKKVIAKNEGGSNLRKTMSNEELRAIVARTAKNIDKLSQELGLSQQKTEASIVSLAEERKKTELAQQKTETLQQKTEAAIVSLVEEGKKTEVSIKELRKELGGVGGAQGDIAEDLFRRNAQGLLQARKIPVQELHYALKGPNAEFDLVAGNEKEIVLTEVKSRLRSSDIHDLIHRQIPLFKKYFGSDYKGHKIMGGLASMAVDPALEEEVEEAGLFLFTQTKEGGASLSNSPDFVPKTY